MGKLQSMVSERIGTGIEKSKTMIKVFNKKSDGGNDQSIWQAGTEMKKYRKKLEHLYDVAQKVSSASQVSKLVTEILCVTRQITRASASSLLLIDGEKGELYFHDAGKRTGGELSQMTISLDTGIASWVLSNGAPLVINDVTGDERFNEEIDKVTGFVTRSVMAAPLLRGQRVIGILEAINRADERAFNEQDLAVLTGFASSEALILLVSMAITAKNNIEQHQILIDWYKNMFETLIAAADAKDLYASGHSSRVKKYTMLAASSLSLSPEELQAIEFGALLHDIGKLWIHDNVLRKAGPLTDEEWYIMRKHSLKGAHMLNGIRYLEKVKDIVLYHHERYDGKGYPHGLKGEDIPFGARLVAVADAYDTMTTAHSYREKMSDYDAIDQLIEGSGKQFCPIAVEAFVSAFERSQGTAVDFKARLEAKRSPEGDTGELAKAEDAAKAASAPGMETYEGDVTLLITSPDGFGQVRQFKKCLEKVDDLKIVLEGWSEAEGNIIIVSVQKPMALISVLNRMSMVEKVDKKRSKLMIILKVPAESKAFENGFNLA